ncbi:helix-turn-helix domain-containing protein [Streptomyces sp. NPDC003247]|uniref:helix-turn-helix domain-containing protein n=1 Tax=Streptomyces sp. NPDC003247 TaxID=3364677 RepID=UPI0036B303C3
MALPLPPHTGAGESLYLGLCRENCTTETDWGEELSAAAGDLLFLGTKTPSLQLYGDDFAFFRIPFPYLGISVREGECLAGLHVRGDSGVAALASQFLGSFAQDEWLARSHSGRRLALNAADLLALLVAELLAVRRPVPADATDAVMFRIRAHIEEHLGDTDLGPESIARAHFMSVRYLHKLFQRDGVTVSAYIRRRRLDACRLELGRPPSRRRSVAAVAQTYGFVSPSHFSRVFRSTFGTSPSQWQERVPQNSADDS